MAYVQHIHFPYGATNPGDGGRLAIFFGTDFHNLPRGSDETQFALKTNQMLAYMREHITDCSFVYQPHPNETDEHTLLDLTGFTVGEKTMAEVLLYERRDSIKWVFAACSWAAGSAYAMGFRSGIFLDTLKGAVEDDVITGYRSYFEGLPDSFFISSFTQELPPPPPRVSEEAGDTLRRIDRALEQSKEVWFLTADPAYALRAAILAGHLSARGVRSHLLRVSHRRWKLVHGAHFFEAFSSVREIPRVWYSARPAKVLRALWKSRAYRRIPIAKGDAIISFSHAQFEENCLISKHRSAIRILMLESRWYYFSYDEATELPIENFHVPWGTRLFNTILEPLLGLHRTIFREYKDGRVLNIHRYRSNLRDVYDAVFVLEPLSKRVPREDDSSENGLRS